MTRPYRPTWAERKAARQDAEAAAALVLARGPVVPPADDLARVAHLLANHPWKYARSMPQNPHYYTLRWHWPNDAEFVWVVRMIRAWGFVERWPDAVKGWPYIKLNIGDWSYWTMGDKCDPEPYCLDGKDNTILINRKSLVP
jgi:hypothetical protein